MVRWNLWRAAALGGAVGAVYIAYVTITERPGAALVDLAASSLGGAIAGAVVFSLVAGIRNFAVR